MVLIKKTHSPSEEWALMIGQPRYPSSLGPEALRPTLSGGVAFSTLFRTLLIAGFVPRFTA
jgi:hypothetical protein